MFYRVTHTALVVYHDPLEESHTMEEVLQSILINTYNPDANLRGQAEKALDEFLRAPGAMVALLNFVANSQTRELRQATCITLKNKTRGFWEADCDTLPTLSPEEKEFTKHKLLEILLTEQVCSV